MNDLRRYRYDHDERIERRVRANTRELDAECYSLLLEWLTVQQVETAWVEWWHGEPRIGFIGKGGATTGSIGLGYALVQAGALKP